MGNRESFNRKRCIELLEKRNIFRSQGKIFEQECPKENLELLGYRVILENQIYYNQKSKYYSLFEDYLTSKINTAFFRYRIFQLYRENIKALDTLKEDLKQVSTFSIDSRSEQFLDLMEEVFGYCEFLILDSNPKPEESFLINEDRFRSLIEKTFLQLQESFDR